MAWANWNSDMDVETDFPDGGKATLRVDEVSYLHFRQRNGQNQRSNTCRRLSARCGRIFQRIYPAIALAMITRRQAVTPMLIVNSPVSEQFRLLRPMNLIIQSKILTGQGHTVFYFIGIPFDRWASGRSNRRGRVSQERSK